MKLTETDEYTILLDENLTEEEVREHSHVYRDIREALQAPEFKNASGERPVTLLIAPGVYWIDDPLAQDTVYPKRGQPVPFGLEVDCANLKIRGLSERPEDVVIAGNRGQSHGSCGNYTMFLFRAEELVLSNLTLGNYCCVDLVYEKDPSRNQGKRCEAVTQAQIAFQSGRRLYACNCRFVGRLNLCPVCGAGKAFYQNCHFESTDDALNGNAVYLECDFDFYGSRPIYQAQGTGAVFLDCDFYSRFQGDASGKCQYLTKEGGQVVLADCRFHSAEDKMTLGWTKYPDRALRCYQYRVSLNGRPVRLGAEGGKETVELEGSPLSETYVTERDGKTVYNTSALLEGSTPVQLLIKAGGEQIATGGEGVTLTGELLAFSGEPWTGEEAVRFFMDGTDSSYVKMEQTGERTCVLTGCNETESQRRVSVYAVTPSGLEACAQVTVLPRPVEAPVFVQEPVMYVESGVRRVEYRLSDEKRTDKTEISWYRLDKGGEDGEIPVAVSGESPLKSYLPGPGDVGKYLKAVLTPKVQGSPAGATYSVCAESPVEKAETDEKVIFTDFSCLPITGSEKLAPDFWTFDCARPMDVKPDSEEFGSFSPDMDRAAWCYGETGNGSVGRGLYQNTQGARLRYTPAGKTYGDMSVTVEADPAKTAGQGFGSAGQYMDVCIKFDTERLSGYGLRIQRRKEASDAVFMALVEYREGRTRLLTDFCITSCFLTGCTIRLAAEGGMLRATVTTKTAQSESHREKGYAHRVTLSAPAEENSCGGLCLWHTGTPGTGGWQNTTMLHSIEIRYL